MTLNRNDRGTHVCASKAQWRLSEIRMFLRNAGIEHRDRPILHEFTFKVTSLRLDIEISNITSTMVEIAPPACHLYSRESWWILKQTVMGSCNDIGLFDN